jgi:hypothetical protein
MITILTLAAIYGLAVTSLSILPNNKGFRKFCGGRWYLKEIEDGKELVRYWTKNPGVGTSVLEMEDYTK